MATAELASASQRAILERVRAQLPRLTPGVDTVIGIRSPPRPVWHGAGAFDIDGRPVRVAACPSVLAVLDALASQEPGSVLVVLTDQPESELGDAVLARVHRGRLLEADRYTLLDDLLGARQLDPRIRAARWLVDALVELAAAEALPPTAGAVLSRSRVLALVATARLGRDPEQTDLPGLVGIFDDSVVRQRWRSLAGDERAGLTEHLVSVHGGAASVIASLAVHRDDLLADLLVAQAITSAPVSHGDGAVAYGRFIQSRFDGSDSGGSAFRGGAPERDDLSGAGAAAVDLTSRDDSARVSQQIRRADETLELLHASDVAVYSPVLPRGYVERLARAAADLNEDTLAEVARHRDAGTRPHRYDRLLAALRLRRWLHAPLPAMDTAAAGLTHHARELAWVDRALAQVRAGDADPRVQRVLAQVAGQAGAARTAIDTAFAARLAAAPDTPAHLLAVETLLPSLVAALARQNRVLLVVVDGMSGAVAGDLTDRLTDHRSGWAEVVRSPDGGREAVLAALPTETTYSRTSLFCAELRAGTASDERAAFAAHGFWPPGGAVLVHKSGLVGADGGDLGAELEQALGPDGRAVVAVVLNAVDDSLSGGRQSVDPAWRPADVSGLPQLLDRAALAGRIVVLTSDHGHVLEHGSELRSDRTGGARWRAAGALPQPDEVLVYGPRVLTPEGRAVLAATEELRYGARAHGYHGGATLAEVAIPLVVLLPPGMDVPAGWHPHTLGPPAWWSGADAVRPPAPSPSPAPARRPVGKTRPSARQSEALFDVAASEPALTAVIPSRGAQFVASESFRSAYIGFPANRVPDPAVFVAVVDALVAAGGRLPVASVLVAGGSVGRNARGVVAALGRVLNRDSFPVITLVDGGRAVALDVGLLNEQFPP
ncbi:MAG: BREX-2 system phosphatase PglZ [Pseudonocardiaceae bacterium]